MLEMGRFPDYPGSILVTLFELYFTLTPHTFFFCVCVSFSLSLSPSHFLLYLGVVAHIQDACLPIFYISLTGFIYLPPTYIRSPQMSQ